MASRHVPNARSAAAAPSPGKSKVLLVDDHAVAQQRVSAAVVGDDPFCLDQRSHPYTSLSPNISFFDRHGRLSLHAPALHGVLFDEAEDDGLDDQSDHDDRE